MIDSIVTFFAQNPVAHGFLLGVLVRHTLGRLFQRKVGKDDADKGKSRIQYF